MTQHAYDLPRHEPAGPSRDVGIDRVELRPIESAHDYQACVELQIDVWGEAFGDRVPASLLQVAVHIGGLTVGAFAPDGTMLGFVFGLTGVTRNEIVHWSHMLGVRAAVREMGIGRRLKEYQRAELARRGIRHTYWTFDPLQSKNAHLNFNRLGVRVVQYAVDMYGTTASPLHYGLATDRLIVVSSNMPEARRAPLVADIEPTPAHLPVLTHAPRAGDVPFDAQGHPAAALIEIPTDLQAVVAHAPAEALEWRAATRRHFQWALANGYTVSSLRRDADTGRAFYLIIHDPTSAARGIGAADALPAHDYTLLHR